MVAVVDAEVVVRTLGKDGLVPATVDVVQPDGAVAGAVLARLTHQRLRTETRAERGDVCISFLNVF